MSVIEYGENLVKEIEKASSDDIHSISLKLGEDVMGGKVKLVKIVELLGPSLTNTDIKQRKKGVEVLAETLAALKPDYLTEIELAFLTTFFCDRMKDHHSIASSVLQGILALVDMNNLPSDSPILICTSLFSQIHCQTLTQPERNMVYRLFQKFLSSKVDDLKPLGIDFVLGFITAIDGERDPRNLMLLFSILPSFFASFPLLHLAEEAFTVVSCYFPIDFNAAAEEHAAYTREDLSFALAPCLVAVPAFAEFCIPLALEKLDSNLRVAKMDSLHLLKEACKAWPVELLEPHLVDIWLSLKKELLPGNTDVRTAAGEVLIAVICKLDEAGVDKRETILSSFVDDIISSTSGLLSDMSLSLFSPAIHILVSASSASEFVCKKIVSYVVPKLYALQQSSSQDTVIVIGTLNLFLKAQLKHLSNSPSNDDTLDDVWSVLPDMLLGAISNSNCDVQEAAFECLSTLAPHLSHSNRNIIYESCESVLSKGNESVRSSCVTCLKILAVLYPLEVKDNLVQSKLLIDKGCSDVDKQKWRIETLCSFLLLPDFTESVSHLLLNLIDEFSSCASTVLHSLRALLEKSDLNDPAIKVLCVIVTKRLVTWWTNSMEQSDCCDIFNNEDVLIDSAAIIECLIRPQESSLQTEITSSLIQLVTPVDETGFEPSNLSKSSISPLCSKVLLLEGLLESLHQDVIIPDWEMLTTTLSSIAFNSSHQLTQLSASRLLATFLNKQQNDESLAMALGHLAKSLEEKLKSCDKEENAVRLLSWITKALVLRGHSLMSYWLDKLTDQLASSTVGITAAKGFHLLMSEDKLHLTTLSHCTVRILYRQRLFQRIPTLVSASRSCHPNCKISYLLAIAHFIQAVPRIVLLPYLRQVVLPMVESLEYDYADLQLITLETLSNLLAEKESALESYTDTFIPRFLNLAQQSPFMKVRMAALQCIKNYGDYSPVLLMPYVQTVLRDLEMCLDDKKRLVRKAAVDARSKWFLIGAPTDDD